MDGTAINFRAAQGALRSRRDSRRLPPTILARRLVDTAAIRLVDQYLLSALEVGGVETFGEPVADLPTRGSGRSAIDRRHDPIGVALPRDFSRRQSVVEQLHLRGIKLYGPGRHILFEIFSALGAGDRHDVATLMQ
jgi:hypothetical protein